MTYCMINKAQTVVCDDWTPTMFDTTSATASTTWNPAVTTGASTTTSATFVLTLNTVDMVQALEGMRVGFQRAGGAMAEWTFAYNTFNADGPAVTPPPLFPVIVLKRAERLLRRALPAKQAVQWERNGRIYVPSPSDPAVVYRIPKSGLIRMFRHGRHVHDLCIYGNHDLPVADRVLSMKMLIEAEEQEFLKTAIVHKISVPRPEGRRVVDPRVELVAA